MGVELPQGLEQDSLLIDDLEAAMVGDQAYFSLGELTEDDIAVDGYFYNTFYLGHYLNNKSSVFAKLGELAEKPGKVDSKVNRLKTRNYQIPGRRSSSLELQLCGLSEAQRDYFESSRFSGEQIVIILCTNQLAQANPLDKNEYGFSSPIVIFNGLRWATDWLAEADGLWSVTLSSELSGSTRDRIWPMTLPAYDPLSELPLPWVKEE